MFAGQKPPLGWIWCDGAPLEIARYKNLFDVIGSQFGGDGRTIFAVPDLSGRSPVHPGTIGESTPCTLGSQGGNSTKSIAAENLPRHRHTMTGRVRINMIAGNLNTPIGAYPANTGATDGEYNNTHDGSYMAADILDVKVQPSTNWPGSSLSIQNRQAYLVMNFAICYKGIVAPRP